MGRKNVESDREFLVRRIEQHDIVDSFRWNHTKHPLNQVAVRIEDSDAFTIGDVLLN